MNAEDIASVMLLAPDLLSDEDILMLILNDCDKEQSVHYKYDRFRLENFSEAEFVTNFRFKKDDIDPLMNALQINDEYTGPNGIKWSGIEGLCAVLRRLAYPNRLLDIVPLFGRHKTELSVIINKMVLDMYSKNLYTLNTVFQPWLQHADFAKAVTEKGAVLKNIWGFLDGTQGRICRPHDGQESVFNGHKRIHSLKYQSLICPNGIIAHFFGPVEGRRHDSAMYYQSGLDELISDIVDDDNNQLAIYGDSAYAFRRYLVTPFKGANLSQLQHDFNANMSAMRASVEWGFAKMFSEFAFLDYHKNLKVYLQPVAKYYFVGAVLINAHTCLYGSQTGQYFGLQAPSLDEYFY